MGWVVRLVCIGQHSWDLVFGWIFASAVGFLAFLLFCVLGNLLVGFKFGWFVFTRCVLCGLCEFCGSGGQLVLFGWFMAGLGWR